MVVILSVPGKLGHDLGFLRECCRRAEDTRRQPPVPRCSVHRVDYTRLLGERSFCFADHHRGQAVKIEIRQRNRRALIMLMLALAIYGVADWLILPAYDRIAAAQETAADKE